MKNILILLTVLITHIVATGQQENAAAKASLDNHLNPNDQIIDSQGNEKNALAAEGFMENPYDKRDSTLTYTFSTVLDSMPSKRYKYQHSGNETTEIYYQYDENEQEWLPTTKRTYVFNENGKTVEETEMQWEESLEDWSPLKKEVDEFNDAGIKTLHEQSLWDDAEAEWYVSEKFEQSFNASNRKTDSIYYEYSEAEGLQPKTKGKWYYNDDNKLDSTIKYTHDGSQYVNDSKEFYLYNEDGYKEKKTHWNWTESLSTWQLSYKWEFSYNNQNKLTNREKSSWNFATGWSRVRKNSIGYNNEGYENVTISYEWDSNNGEYVPQNKVEYTYPTNLDTSAVANIIGYTYDSNAETFVYSYKNEVEYTDFGAWSLFSQMFWDENNSEWVPDVKFQFSYNNSHQLTISERHEKDPNSNDWKLLRKSFYYYSDPSAIPAHESNVAFSAFPVPAENNVTFNLDAEETGEMTLSVYNTRGQLVHREEVSNSRQGNSLHWDVSGNPPGMYTAVLETSEVAITRKIIVK
ncbi:MAG: T9SS type A sorting domain-containing protein [Bacteroidales bacterium]|nr:T9SS type A sorting domain-containing protein [Bacteroidales bacterium]MCF8337089.1 T9SS type A sorting domain-containing protein [Bacteroidales bacterium]